MSGHSHDQTLPRMPLYSAIALVLTIITVVGLARIAGAGVTSVPAGAPVMTRDLLFEDRTDGSILVRDANLGRDVTVLEPGSNGFVRGTLRALVRDRRREEIGGHSAFRLAAWPDGRLTLEDPATGRSIGLEAFGVTNMEAFARFLTAEGAMR